MAKKTIKTIISALFLCAGLYCLVCGFTMLSLGATSAGVFLSIFTGLFLSGWAIFSRRISQLCKNKYFAALRFFVVACIVAGTVVIIFIAAYGNNDTVNYREDAIIVLGAGLKGDKITYPLAYRLEKAIAYSKINENAVIVVSGGKGYGETVTEGYAMKKYLTENGVDPSRIITEEKSTSTSQNLKFSKQLLDLKFKNNYTCAIITNKFHVFRASLIAKRAGLSATHAGAKIQPYSVPVNYLRELFALIKYALFKS